MIPIARRRRPRLETVRQRLDRWRETRGHARAPLPRRLWATAVALVPEHGLYGTARALGVSYGALKRHVDQHKGEPRERATTRFVELPPPSTTYVIEIEGAAGPRVRVRLNGPTLAEVAGFARLVVGATS
jgi:hypothetical protein